MTSSPTPPRRTAFSVPADPTRAAHGVTARLLPRYELAATLVGLAYRGS